MVLTRDFFNFSVIKAPLMQVLGAFDSYPPMRVKSSLTPAAFPQQNYPGDPNHPLIMWSPSINPGLTAFMPHVGSGANFVGSYLTAFGFSHIELLSTDHANANAINAFACYEGKTLRRFVRAMREEPRWQFFEQGAPLEFEDVAAYRRRLVRERLTRAMVLKYAEYWGAPIGSDSFWQPLGQCYTFR